MKKPSTPQTESQDYICNGIDFEPDTFTDRLICSLVTVAVLVVGFFIFLFIGHKLPR